MAKRAKSLQAFIDGVNQRYSALHLAYENQFWGTKMNLAGAGYSKQLEAETKTAMEGFLRDPQLLTETRDWLKGSDSCSEEQLVCLKTFERTFSVYIMEDEQAVTLREALMLSEGELEEKRAHLKLGYTDVDGKWQEGSSVALRNCMRTSEDQAVRKSCYDGLTGIGEFVVGNGFVEMVRERNQMAKLLGFVDFYDYKVTAAEGFGKVKLFEILDGLEEATRDLMGKARALLSEDKGPDALMPWNMQFLMAGDTTAQLDPYFPFEKAVERWGRSFHALGIGYQAGSINLDLLDRPGKYSNGFCHWPHCSWVKPGGDRQPSSANFTSLADPGAVGSGMTALTTLMHEAGHAAHFANIEQPTPLCSQERAPTSVAYAENQSMFLDSLVGDAAWRVRYAKDRDDKPVPWELLEADIKARHPYEVFGLRGMLAVPYFEKALYELDDAQLTPERIVALANETELAIQGGPSPRPLLSVPHILSDEASCYYHGYVLAEMSVHQTRAHFLQKYNYIVDNPQVGQDLQQVYLSLIHISEPTRLLSISYAVFCLKKKKKQQNKSQDNH
eukprot:TRINITY_DN26551_c0_g1_i2.p1 TRINITY_DN26551_c0_g1~~TRINITY_DN26551_c0_g1_i2.p1  ORF type:complete len:559 (+),score=168.05 TRINITY_DN26551_c0_g1_i2:223-1899(+)